MESPPCRIFSLVVETPSNSECKRCQAFWIGSAVYALGYSYFFTFPSQPHAVVCRHSADRILRLDRILDLGLGFVTCPPANCPCTPSITGDKFNFTLGAACTSSYVSLFHLDFTNQACFSIRDFRIHCLDLTTTRPSPIDSYHHMLNMVESPPTKRIKLEDSNSKEDVRMATHRPLSKMIDIHSRGDIILEVGSGQHTIAVRVSSSILAAAGQSWIDLLGLSPHESNNTGTIDEPKRVPVSADDPLAMLDLCRILHHRLDHVEGSRGRPLLAVALVCNKYACEESLSLWMSIQLEKHLRSAQGPMTTLKPLTPLTTPTSIEGPKEPVRVGDHGHSIPPQRRRAFLGCEQES